MACVKPVHVQTMKNHIEKHPTHNNKWAQSARRGRETLHGEIPKVDESEECVPGRFYKKGCETCFCNDMKAFNCTGSCEEKISLKSSSRRNKQFPFKPEDINYFDVLKHLSDKCIPGKMYRIDCNGCLCREANNLICENKLCVSQEAISKLEAKRLSGKKCSEDTTHGCVKCKCVSKTTKCKAIPKCTDRERLSGNAHKVPLALNVNKEKCTPGMIYTVQCNQCYCQRDSTLRCTQKACLNYAQVVKLHKQVDDLEKQGL